MSRVSEMPVVCELRYTPVKSERERSALRAAIAAVKQQALAKIREAMSAGEPPVVREKMQAGGNAGQLNEIPPLIAHAGGADHSEAPPATDARGRSEVDHRAHNPAGLTAQAGSTPAPATLGSNAACAAAATNRDRPGSGPGAPTSLDLAAPDGVCHDRPPKLAADGAHRGVTPTPQPAPSAAPDPAVPTSHNAAGASPAAPAVTLPGGCHET